MGRCCCRHNQGVATVTARAPVANFVAAFAKMTGNCIPAQQRGVCVFAACALRHADDIHRPAGSHAGQCPSRHPVTGCRQHHRQLWAAAADTERAQHSILHCAAARPNGARRMSSCRAGVCTQMCSSVFSLTVLHVRRMSCCRHDKINLSNHALWHIS